MAIYVEDVFEFTDSDGDSVRIVCDGKEVLISVQSEEPNANSIPVTLDAEAVRMLIDRLGMAYQRLLKAETLPAAAAPEKP